MRTVVVNPADRGSDPGKALVGCADGNHPRAVHEYVEHYHRERNHQGLDNQLLQRPPPPRRPDADVRRRARLGGLLSFYYREAA